MVFMQKVRAVTCALVGHSNILSASFGYLYCRRCGERVGDSLAGVGANENQVINGCRCKACPERYAAMGWRDKLFTPRPTFEESQS